MAPYVKVSFVHCCLQLSPRLIGGSSIDAHDSTVSPTYSSRFRSQIFMNKGMERKIAMKANTSDGNSHAISTGQNKSNFPNVHYITVFCDVFPITH